MLSNELPDIFKVTASDYASLKKAGMLKNLSTAYEYASDDVKTFLNRDPDVIKRLTDADGGIYAVPQYSDNRRGVPVMYIRQDWLNELKLSVPETPEELYEVLKAVQTKERGNVRTCDEQCYFGFIFFDRQIYECVRVKSLCMAFG